VRQQLGKLGDGMGGDSGEDVFKPGERIDSDPLAGCHETAEHGSGLATLVAAEEYPVISTDGYRIPPRLIPHRLRGEL